MSGWFAVTSQRRKIADRSTTAVAFGDRNAGSAGGSLSREFMAVEA